MATHKSAKSASRNKLVAAIKADPKKSAVLTILVVVMVGMWVKMFFLNGGGPKTAVAATSAEASGKGASGRAGKEGASTAMQEWLRAPVPTVSRNLFAVKFDYFPQDASKINQTLVPPNGNGFWDQVAKSMTQQADQNRDRQIRIQNLQIQAAQLRLQSIMMGPQPKALIDGELVGEGDVVALFRVSKIEARRIIVEREGILLEILMK